MKAIYPINTDYKTPTDLNLDKQVYISITNQTLVTFLTVSLVVTKNVILIGTLRNDGSGNVNVTKQ